MHPNTLKVLDTFDEYQNTVNSKKKVVKHFLRVLKQQLKNSDLIDGSFFIKVGSSFEETVVSPRADFDLAMVLPQPFTMDFFNAVEIDEYPGILKLQVIDHGEFDNLDKYVNKRDFLITRNLLDDVFDELEDCVNNISLQGYSISCKKQVASFVVKLTDSGDQAFKLDIVPQISGQLSELPNWDWNKIPSRLKNWAYTTDINVLLTICSPPALKTDYVHLVAQVNFSLIEKEAMLADDTVRDAVRLAKAVAREEKWLHNSLRNFIFKRIAISCYDKIADHGDPWQGFKTLLSVFKSELERDCVDGYLIKDQVMLWEDNEDKRLDVVDEIESFLTDIHPSNLLNYVNLT